VARHIALAHDASHRLAVIADNERADLVLLQDLEKLLNGRVGANRHHKVAFTADHV
jgi:hypothetical protein